MYLLFFFMFKYLPSPPRWLQRTLLVGLSSLSTFSCKRELELPIVNAGQYAVSEAQARTVAENIYASSQILAQSRHNQEKSDTQQVFRGRQLLRNLTAVLASDGEPSFYICNYIHGGFSIIAADRHMHPLLAFAEHGALPTTDLQNLQVVPDGLVTWLENTKRIAVALRQNPSRKNVAAGVEKDWTTMENPICPDLGDGQPSTCDDQQPTYSSNQVGPLIQSTWGQNVPYNGKCYFNGVSCLTGCVATTMAQIMRYWQYPSYYQWSAMPYTIGSVAYPEMAQLMRDAGESVNTSYGANSSSAATFKVPDALKNFGYSSADYHDYPNGSSGSNVVFYAYGNGTSSYFDVIGNLNAGKPVIFGGYTDQTSYGGNKYGTGEGHNWVGDGYIQSYYNGTGYLQFHMNWGWDRSPYDGWFAFDNWPIYDNYGRLYKNFQYCQDIVINIHP